MAKTKCNCDEINHDWHLDTEGKPYMKCFKCGEEWEAVGKPIPSFEPLDLSNLSQDAAQKLLDIFNDVH